MEERKMAQLVGSLRVGISAGLLVAPGFAGRIWVGPGADGPGAMVFARAVGARDLLLGIRTLQSLRDSSPVQHWMKLGFTADAATAAATAIAFKNLTPARRFAMPLIAAGVAALGFLAAEALD